MPHRLADGLHWERSPAYHFYTLMGICEIAAMLDHCNVDLWHAGLPQQEQNDGYDLHRAYGPRGPVTLKAAFDAPLHQMFSNGDFSQLHDSGLDNIRGVWIWGILYNLAYEAYQDPRYAWLLNHLEKAYPDDERDMPGLPMPLQTANGDLDFARLTSFEIPPKKPTAKQTLQDRCMRQA